MNEFLYRTAVALLLVCGVLTLGISAFGVWRPSDAATAGLLVHRQLMVALLGLGLVIARFVPSWRLPTVIAALLSKLSWLGVWATVAETPAFASATSLEGALVALLIFAGLVLAHQAWFESRWDGMLPLRPEA